MSIKAPRLEYALLAGVALLLGGIGLFATFWMHLNQTNESDLKYLRHSREVIQSMNEFKIVLLELELSERDYLITGRDPFLENHTRYRNELLQRHHALSEMVADNPQQAARAYALQPLLKARLALSEQLLGQRDDYGLSGAQPLIAQGLDHVHNGRIDEVLRQMQIEEAHLLQARRDKFDVSMGKRKSLAMASVAIIMGLLIALMAWVRQELQRRRRRFRQLNHFAHIDLITGLPNRRQFLLTASTMLALAQRQQSMIAVMMLDLDGFKGVNDSYGHEVGDKLLHEVGQRLQASIRASDLVARFGGDEFAIVMSEADNLDHVRGLAQKLIDAICAPYALDEGHFDSVGISIGIALFPEHGADVDTLLQHADRALYASKRTGRRRYTVYNATLAEMEQA